MLQLIIGFWNPCIEFKIYQPRQVPKLTQLIMISASERKAIMKICEPTLEERGGEQVQTFTYSPEEFLLGTHTIKEFLKQEQEKLNQRFLSWPRVRQAVQIVCAAGIVSAVTADVVLRVTGSGISENESAPEAAMDGAAEFISPLLSAAISGLSAWSHATHYRLQQAVNDSRTKEGAGRALVAATGFGRLKVYTYLIAGVEAAFGAMTGYCAMSVGSAADNPDKQFAYSLGASLAMTGALITAPVLMTSALTWMTVYRNPFSLEQIRPFSKDEIETVFMPVSFTQEEKSKALSRPIVLSFEGRDRLRSPGPFSDRRENIELRRLNESLLSESPIRN